MNNSVFGKTMENIRKRVDVKLITDPNKVLKITSKPTFVSNKIFNKNLVAVHKININNMRLYDAYRIKFDPYKESDDE